MSSFLQNPESSIHAGLRPVRTGKWVKVDKDGLGAWAAKSSKIWPSLGSIFASTPSAAQAPRYFYGERASFSPHN